MTVNRKSTGRGLREPRVAYVSGRVRPTAAELAALDAHEPVPDDESPEFTAADAARGVLHRNGKPIGRPKAAVTKEMISLRLSPDVLSYFRGTGPGWQTRIDAALKKVAKKAVLGKSHSSGPDR
jgi:uncharacterized protein (DUF4415 family)